MKLIFERSIPGHGQTLLPPCDVPEVTLDAPARQTPLHLAELQGVTALNQVREALADFYAGQTLISVATAEETAAKGKLYGNAKAGTDSLEIVVAGNDERATLTALFDNLGKGASGAAIQNMNLALGLEPGTGLVL